ncbi:TIGR03915 family putative DNA repair protein, partial [Bosea sp. (in: a-proteobacteria)]|uniref:TIGR03915 family putative DNA repair protein n=1 Tax=Bosea sp. (in: a-proteobacteria) TaxID=1871050 RepID=UPI002FCBE206
MSDSAPRHIVLAEETDLDGFRRAARDLLAQDVAPERVSWSTEAGDRLLDWSGAPTVDADAGAGTRTAVDNSAAGPIKVPAAFVELCRCAILHRDPRRFGLLYRLLWRLLHEPGLRHDPLDHDTMAAHSLARAVRRDLHKMKAFVRFRELRGADASDTADTPASTANADAVNAVDVPASSGARGVAAALITHVAWFEPEHHIVEAVAPFFASRFASVRWAILTPERSVRWDGERLAFGPGARREDAPPADAGERLWLTYYEHIFNPARLKLAAMQKEMPRRYWRNLPEARLIEPLAAQATVRSEAMVAREAALPRRRLPQTSVRPGGTSASDIDSGASGNIGNASSTSAGAPGAAHALAALRKATDRCRECPIGEHATQSVTGEGPPGARLMLVGE